jgi:hypothetical protein
MQRTAAIKLALVNTANRAAANRALPPLSESQAAEIMWVYYRDHKSQLISDIKEYRAGILATLMDGMPAAQVFAPFAKPAEPAKPMRRAA